MRFDPWKAPEIRAPHLWLASALIAVALAATFHDALPTYSFFRTGNNAAAPDALASGRRPFEPRLSGAQWAPLGSGPRGDGGASYSSALGTAAEARGETSSEMRHSTGIAELLSGKYRAAIDDLSAAAESSPDAAKWNNVAVAYYETALRYDAPELLADALGAADRALALDSRFAEALFNRALVLERLGFRDDARLAWERYLAADHDSRWATEARDHLQDVQPLTPFEKNLEGRYERLLRAPEEARELGRRDPQGARIQGVLIVVTRWAEAVIAGDDTAARHLAIARVLGEQLAQNGDTMLQQTVAAIDAADPDSRATLAAAHIDYANASSLLDSNPTKAEPLFRDAAEKFESGRSQFAAMAWYQTANALFNQGDIDEAQKILDKTLAGLSKDFRASRAHIQSQIGACHFRRAAWGPAMDALKESVAIFDSLGELGNSASSRRVMALIYDRTGDRAKAWKERMKALGDGGRTSGLDLAKTIASIVDDAVLRQEWHTAKSFLTLEIDMAERTGEDIDRAATLLMRAAVRQRLGDLAGARADLTEGGAVAASIEELSYREWLKSDADFVRSMLPSSPEDAADLLTGVIAFQWKRGDRMNLPSLYLQRARALRKAGDLTGAAADLERGIEVLESQRESLPAGEARWGAFLPAEELFEEAIRLALDERDVARAFAMAERARARSLLDIYGRTPALDTRRLAENVVVVEYAVLPDRLVIFTADASAISVSVSQVNRQQVVREVNALIAALQDDKAAAARQAATALHGRLVKPIESRLVGAGTVVFVPDRITATIPFGSLRSGDGKYLLEQHTVVAAPSAAVYVATEERHRVPRTPESVLVVTNAAPSGGGGRLSFVTGEARQVADAYPTSFVLHEGAQVDELKRRAPQSDSIHFGGHAIGDDSGLEPASIVLQQDGRERRLTVSEIAGLHLSRTSVVVLAGCSTARGERRGTEGVMSVAYGFLHAGAPSVIATLWPVDDDASARFFPRIHKLLAEGRRPAEALREVQRQAIREGNFPLSLWAAIQIIGS